MTQVVNFTTRGNNILDLIFTKYADKILNIKNYPPIANSDHSLIFAEYKPDQIGKFHFKKIYYKNFAKADYRILKEYFSQTLDGLLNLELSCSEIWNIFNYTIKTAINLFVPLDKFIQK